MPETEKEERPSTGLNRLEQSVNELAAQLAEFHDIQLIDKLDLVNMKNEIERLRLVLPAIAPENEERFAAINALVEKADTIKKIQSLAEDVDTLKKEIAPKESRDAKWLHNQVEILTERVAGLETGGPASRRLALIEERLARMEQLGNKSLVDKLRQCGACGAPLKDKAQFCGSCGKRL